MYSPFGGAPLELTDLAISFPDSVISATASIPSEFYPLPVRPCTTHEQHTTGKVDRSTGITQLFAFMILKVCAMSSQPSEGGRESEITGTVNNRGTDIRLPSYLAHPRIPLIYISKIETQLVKELLQIFY